MLRKEPLNQVLGPRLDLRRRPTQRGAADPHRGRACGALEELTQLVGGPGFQNLLIIRTRVVARFGGMQRAKPREHLFRGETSVIGGEPLAAVKALKVDERVMQSAWQRQPHEEMALQGPRRTAAAARHLKVAAHPMGRLVGPRFQERVVGAQAGDFVRVVAAEGGSHPLDILKGHHHARPAGRPGRQEFSQPRQASHQAQFIQDDPPRNVDRYVWRDGVISGPEPVRIVGAADELPARLFRASAVNLRAVPRLARRGDRLPFEGSETSGIIIESGRPFVPFVRFLVNVSGTRESRQMRADPRGRVYEII